MIGYAVICDRMQNRNLPGTIHRMPCQTMLDSIQQPDEARRAIDTDPLAISQSRQ